ncbi:MAG: hypothetical protein WAW73_07355 [Rhodoferax sp.]
MKSDTFYRGITYEVTIKNAEDGQWVWTTNVVVNGKEFSEHGIASKETFARGSARISAEKRIDEQIPK